MYGTNMNFMGESNWLMIIWELEYWNIGKNIPSFKHSNIQAFKHSNIQAFQQKKFTQ